jgi:hypothetical protein
MKVVRRRPIDHRVVSLLTDVPGQVLHQVRYVVPRGAPDWPSGHRHDAVHEVDLGVEFVTRDDKLITVSWAMEGVIEGLSAELSGEAMGPSNDPLHVQDVGATAEWLPYIDRPFGNLAFAWQVANASCPETLWSLRFNIGDGAVTVALGEQGGGHIEYQPDSLLVIFDQEIALRYRIPASLESAWGQPWGIKTT